MINMNAIVAGALAFAAKDEQYDAGWDVFVEGYSKDELQAWFVRERVISVTQATNLMSLHVRGLTEGTAREIV